MRNVYINPDLTKAQATAAYQLHCQKRQARMEKKLPTSEYKRSSFYV